MGEQQGLLRENDARVLDQTLRTIYAHYTSIDALDPDGAIRLIDKDGAENEAVVSMSKNGYRLTLSAGRRCPIQLEIENGVTLTFSNPISVNCTSEGALFDGLPESLETIGDDYLLPFFLGYARRELARKIPESHDTHFEDDWRLSKVKDEIALARSTDLRSGYELVADPLSQLRTQEKRYDSRMAWDQVVAFLESPNVEADAEPTPAGDYMETVFLESIWENENNRDEATGAIIRETANDASVVVSLAIHSQYGFLIAFDDGREELLATLELLISPEKTHVLTENGFEELPEQLYKPIGEFLKRAEEADIED